jgi:signal transduction histidine kinase
MSHFETRTLLAAPLVEKDELVGAIEVVNKRGGGVFNDTDTHVMTMFASLSASAIVNARLIERNIASERMAAIGQTVTGLSQYMKNLLTAMNQSAEQMELALGNDDLDMLMKNWPVLRRTTNHISDFVEDMLAFARPQAGVGEPCDLERLLNEVHQTFRILLTSKNVRMTIDASKVARPVHIDRQGIYRCLLNLLTNAAEAAPDEEGAIEVVALTLPDGRLQIDVSDNGPGIPPQQRRAVFEPFFSTKGPAGAGLGLAVTRKIVEQHDGTISVDTSPLGGALFRIVIPREQPPGP